MASDKTPVLILHGWGSSAERWNRVKVALESAGYTVHAPDLPGHGENPDPPSPIGVEEFGQFVLGYLKENLLEKVHLVGHSNGGRVGIWLAAHHPEVIEKLVLMGSAGLPHTQPPPLDRLGVSSDVTRKLSGMKLLKPIKGIARKILGSKDYASASPVMQETMKKLLTYDATEDAKAISHPTLILWGQHDSYVPVSDADLLNSYIDGSVKKIYPDQKHGPHLTTPTQVAADIVSFLN